MFDSLISWTCNVTGPVFAEGRAPVPEDERTLGGAAFYRIYRTRDGGHITLGGSEMKFVQNLLSALGREDLIELCEHPPGRKQDPVRDFLSETFLAKTRAEWVEFFAGFLRKEYGLDVQVDAAVFGTPVGCDQDVVG